VVLEDSATRRLVALSEHSKGIGRAFLVSRRAFKRVLSPGKEKNDWKDDVKHLVHSPKCPFSHTPDEELTSDERVQKEETKKHYELVYCRAIATDSNQPFVPLLGE
jgi:hypothetical protein